MTTTEFRPRLRNLINIAIQESGLTQRDLAKQIGVSAQVVSRWKTGQVVPDCLQLMKLADATGADWLLDLRARPSGCTHVSPGQAA